MVKLPALFFHCMSGIIRLVLCGESLRKFTFNDVIPGGSFLRSVLFLLYTSFIFSYVIWDIGIVDCFTLLCRYDRNTDLRQQLHLVSGLASELGDIMGWRGKCLVDFIGRKIQFVSLDRYH